MNRNIPDVALDWLSDVNKLVLRKERRDQSSHSLELHLSGVIVLYAWDGLRFETVVVDGRSKGFVDRQQLRSVDPRTIEPAAFAEELMRAIEALRKRLT